MNITREQTEMLRSETRAFTDTYSKKVKKWFTVWKICGIFIIISAVFIFIKPLIGISIAVPTIIFFIVSFFIIQKKEKAICLEREHYSPSGKFILALKELEKDCFSPTAANKFNELLTEEKDIRTRAIIRNLIADVCFIKGDYNSAYRAIYKDEELFKKDPFFELVYYSDLLRYYVSKTSTTGSTEYAEEAYRSFVSVFDKLPEEKIDFSSYCYANVSQIYLSYHRGDCAKCIEHIDILLEISADNVSKNNFVAAESALYELMKAECLEKMGRYEEALELCDKAGPVLSKARLTVARANQLAKRLHEQIDTGKE